MELVSISFIFISLPDPICKEVAQFRGQIQRGASTAVLVKHMSNKDSSMYGASHFRLRAHSGYQKSVRIDCAI